MGKIRIGTRESQLAIWQATQVKNLLAKHGHESELVFIKSEGDIDLVTPLYDIGVQGIFTRSLDAALLNSKIDIAVHSMKDVPVQLAKGIRQAAVLKRGSHKDILVLHPDLSDRNTPIRKHYVTTTTTGSGKIIKEERWGIPLKEHPGKPGELEDVVIATSSIRRIAQWLNKYPDHKIENLRGNVNTRLKKLKESSWHGAIFAAAGLERIGLRPESAIDLDWMLPAPAQGAIMVVCREANDHAFHACQPFNDSKTALCTKIERDCLSALMGGCSTPISALATVRRNGHVSFSGNIVSPDGKDIASVGMDSPMGDSMDLGFRAAKLILENGGQAIIDKMQNAT
jgi:hydroxymethylbilane synthase